MTTTSALLSFHSKPELFSLESVDGNETIEWLVIMSSVISCFKSETNSKYFESVEKETII